MDYRMHSSPSETETDKASLSDGLMFLPLIILNLCFRDIKKSPLTDQKMLNSTWAFLC
jgi:hypothetical protein